VRHLDPAQGIKPLDVGEGGLTGSVTPDGRWLAVNAYHPTHGYMTLTSMPSFDEQSRHQPERVRAYRRELATGDGFGVALREGIVQRETYLVEDALPLLRFTLSNGVVGECISFVMHGVALQQWRFSRPGRWITLTGLERVQIQRCAYTQLTEGGVLPIPPPGTRHQPRQTDTLLHNPALDATALLSVGSVPGGWTEWRDFEGAETFQVAIALGTQAESVAAALAEIQAADEDALLEQALSRWQQRWASTPTYSQKLELVERKGLAYALQCAVPIDADAICLLTDHMLLPLSWNRDAYYAALPLLHWGAEGAKVVRGHLLWMFERAERIDGAWGRSYLANGQVKDKGYQLDQQIYPLLELAEYIQHTDDTALLARLRPYIQPTLDAIFARQHAATGLLPTDETPADDPLGTLRYHFTSHVLLWHMLNQLESLVATKSPITPDDLKQTIERHFVVHREKAPLYAYAIDGAGNHRLYHDANDVPFALMPLWGYCEPSDETWQNTARFAWSQENEGVYEGRLGSVHTPAPWPLGDAQGMLLARLLGDSERENIHIDNLRQAAQWDGMLPEAHHATDGSVVSRHWFVWSTVMTRYVLEVIS